ncbi:thioredoxin family protein [Algoriphagus boritolerans]|uniref:Thioredoxin n=1 Tax=Algoriphagus boritolerans DSM 17298 = JCM 18970 TaxID=1120964 RepID=A0A1H5S3M4_9BACT|nr:thioredoxin family protein [Algoriphagus boritolerans]SEF44417.1 Thioredoxin [Algoriphagus boritolerans DSM 17298 = JCM 18970]
MEFLSHPVTQKVIDHGLTYPQFVDFTAQLVLENRTTGGNQSEAYLDYTRMCLQRMRRWDKTAKVSAEMQNLIRSITEAQVWLLITEAWCGDGSQSIPYIAKLAESNPLIQLKIIMRDENPEIMDAYLTKGARSIPKLIVFTGDLKVELFVWGPKPEYLINRHKEYKHDSQGKAYKDFLEEIHLWYAKNKNQDLEAELFPLIQSTLIK